MLASDGVTYTLTRKREMGSWSSRFRGGFCLRPKRKVEGIVWAGRIQKCNVFGPAYRG